MSRPLATDDLERLADLTWREIRAWFKPDSCVLATRVFLEVLAGLGLRDAYALSVQAAFVNPAAAQHIDQHHCRLDQPDCHQLAPDGWKVIVGRGLAERARLRRDDPAFTWGGHLVAVVRRRRLYDLSAEQASRPSLGITVDQPVSMPVVEPFLRGRQEIRGDGAGLRVYYHAYPQDRAWQTAPDWQGARARLEAKPQIVAAISQAVLARWRGQPVRYDPGLLRVRQLVGLV